MCPGTTRNLDGPLTPETSVARPNTVGPHRSTRVDEGRPESEVLTSRITDGRAHTPTGPHGPPSVAHTDRTVRHKFFPLCRLSGLLLGDWTSGPGPESLRRDVYSLGPVGRTYRSPPRKDPGLTRYLSGTRSFLTKVEKCLMVAFWRGGWVGDGS